jgi:hypothetical protein
MNLWVSGNARNSKTRWLRISAMNLWVSGKAGNSMTNCETIIFSRRTLLYKDIYND